MSQRTRFFAAVPEPGTEGECLPARICSAGRPRPGILDRRSLHVASQSRSTSQWQAQLEFRALLFAPRRGQ